VHLEQLSCVHFRNLEKLEIDLTSNTVVVCGKNGQGKTNLLEALYVCATGRSFRNAKPSEMLRFGTTGGRVRALVTRQGVRHSIEAELSEHRRTMRVDDRKLSHMSSLLRLVNVVAFFPDDLRIAKGSPENRRRFLDRAVANYQPKLVDASLAYGQAMRSRNSLLRANKNPDLMQIAAYDEQLVAHGEVIHRCREEGLAAMSRRAASQFDTIMPRLEPLTLLLESGVTESGDDFAASFREALKRSFSRDRKNGRTTVGPHRADLCMSIGERDARIFASQGQQRAIVLALKLAEVICLRDELGIAPILLLDDVSSELDAERTDMLFGALAKVGSQLLVSTTGAVELPLPEETQILEVEAGVVREKPKARC